MLGGTIGPYRLVAELGSGGMGTVHRAEGPRGVVALKVVHEHVAVTPGFLARFLREAEIGRGIRHPNLVATLDSGSDGARHWIALEYVEGQTLRSLLEELGVVPEDLSRHIAREAALGLAALHAAGLVHRDVKPENILVTAGHEVKLMDLGIARSTDDAARMTETGMFVGSVQYAAPEQFTGGGRSLDGRADLHALGATLYELATGVHPFERGDVSETLRAVLHDVPRPAHELNPQVSPFFGELLKCLLAKDRDERFADAAAFLAALAAGDSGRWWEDRARHLPRTRRRAVQPRAGVPDVGVFGRERELDSLLAALRDADSGAGRVVIVEGEAGIGKSRLLDALADRATQGAAGPALLYGAYLPGGAASAAGAFATAYADNLRGRGSAPHLTDSPALAPPFDAFLNGSPPPDGATPLTRDSLHTCFVRVTQSLARHRTVIVAIDDLHLAPEEGRALFAAIACAIPRERVLLIGLTRPGLDAAWLADMDRVGASRIFLPRLGPRDLLGLLNATLANPRVAAELCGPVAERTDGNPHFVIEVLRDLRERGVLSKGDDGSWITTARVVKIEVPPSVVELIRARVGALQPEERETLDIAACVGFEFDPTLVCDVLGGPRIPTLRRLAQIERAHRLVRAAGSKYMFDHHQVHEALAGSLGAALRSEYHLAIGEALEARLAVGTSSDGTAVAEVASQFLRSPHPARALRHLENALNALERCGHHRAAVALSGEALAVPDILGAARRADILLRRAERLDYLGERTDERAALDEACALARTAGDPVLLTRALRSRGWWRSRGSDLAGATADAMEALEQARAAGLREQEASVLGELGTLALHAGRLVEAEDYATRMLDAVAGTGSARNQAAALGTLANIASARGDYARAASLAERAADVARVGGDLRREAIATMNAGNAYCWLGRFDDADRLLRNAAEIARRAGDRPTEVLAAGNLGNVQYARGEFEAAYRTFSEGAERDAELDNRRDAATMWVNAGNSLGALGRLSEASACIERGRLLAIAERYDWGHVLAALNLGYLRLHCGRDEEGAALFDVAIGHSDRFRGLRAAATLGLAEARYAQGDRTAAAACLDETTLEMRRTAMTEGLAQALILRGRLDAAAGLDDAARAAWIESTDLSRRSGSVSDELVALALLTTVPDSPHAPADIAARARAAGSRISMRDRVVIHAALASSTGDTSHLRIARDLVEELIAHARPEDGEPMRTRVALYRTVLGTE